MRMEINLTSVVTASRTERDVIQNTFDVGIGIINKNKNSSGSGSNKEEEEEERDEDPIARVCARVEESLDMRSWAPVVYHKDRRDGTTAGKKTFDGGWVTSAEEDDADARATIGEFNRLRASDDPVLTEALLREGVRTGGAYRAARFLERLAESTTTNNNPRPLRIAVFGNSFTIGSNCGESTVDDSVECAWPHRLRRRWEELFPSTAAGGTATATADWFMWQENSQGSLVIAQKLPAFLEHFRSRNTTVDVILMDTSMSGDENPWFEAVIRAFLALYPDVLIVSVVDGLRKFVSPVNSQHEKYVRWLRDVQQAYGLVAVDIARMVGMLRGNSSSSSSSNESGGPDRLWPQSDTWVTAGGDEIDDTAMKKNRTASDAYYWRDFVPRVRKKKAANYPNAHPPWPTHQHAADAVAQALLRTAALGCDLLPLPEGDDTASYAETIRSPPPLPERTVSPPEAIEASPICLEPLTRIDAKAPPPPPPPPLPAPSSTGDGESGAAVVVVDPVCGDWKWVTDERNRAGWQSDEGGSLIRFRLRIGAANPLVVVTYTASYETFGEFRLTFRTTDREPLTRCHALSSSQQKNASSSSPPPPPSLRLQSRIPRYTLPRVVTFSNRNTVQTGAKEWELFNATILSQITAKKAKEEEENIYDDDDDDGHEVDLYVENLGTASRPRVKIQMITAC